MSASSECGEHIAALLTDSAGSHLLETAIGALSDEAYYELYVTFFRGQLVELALDPVANFVVQQLFKHARQPAHVASLVGEIAGDDNGAAMRRLFEGQRSSVVLAAAKACAAHPSDAEQRAMVKAVSSALGAAGGTVTSQLLESLLGLKESASRDLGGRGDIGGSGARAVVKKKRKRGNQKDSISSIGAQIVQAMLAYSPGNNLMLVQSFFAAPNHYLSNLARLGRGCSSLFSVVQRISSYPRVQVRRASRATTGREKEKSPLRACKSSSIVFVHTTCRAATLLMAAVILKK